MQQPVTEVLSALSVVVHAVPGKGVPPQWSFGSVPLLPHIFMEVRSGLEVSGAMGLGVVDTRPQSTTDMALFLTDVSRIPTDATPPLDP